MNATHTVCCPNPVGVRVSLPSRTAAPHTPAPIWARLWQHLQAARSSWQAAAFERHCQRALQGLSEETLRDIGMAERLPPRQQTLGLLDYERGRWS